MGFAFVNNSNIKDITSLNSKMGHFNFFSVHHFNITGVTITAPGDSPNTDGIKMGSCSNIQISDTNIGTGDDCIAILSGTTNLNISNVNCGPGHGISVGSLGKNKDEKDAKDLIVRDVIFNGTSDGIRIKTWESSASKILVSNFVYENIQMIDVGKPINIDQKYCPHPPCEHERKVNLLCENKLHFILFYFITKTKKLKTTCFYFFPGRVSRSNPKPQVKEHIWNIEEQSSSESAM